MGAVFEIDGRRRLTPEQLVQAVTLRKGGETYTAIARLLGVTGQAVKFATDKVLNPERAAKNAAANAKRMNRSRVGGAPRKIDRAGQKTERELAKNALYMAQRREARRALIVRLKAVPCVDCKGSFHQASMQFDHLPGVPKRFTIGERYAHVGEAELLEEISKCEVVCANCHAVRTFNRSGRK
jgi:hypothetical protein